MGKRSRRKIGILTWHFFTNFGSAMQTYALQQTIQKLGHWVQVINYRDKRNAAIFRFASFSRPFLPQNERVPLFFAFQKKRLNMSKCVSTESGLTRKSRKFDTIVAGSDQIWAPSMFNPIYFLDFAVAGVKKVSYAASIGLNNIPDDLCSRYKQLLSSFGHISVRELVGQNLLWNKCGISAELVLDPTLLLDIDEYRPLAKKPYTSEIDWDRPFVFCYFLNREHDYRTRVEAYAHANSLQIVGCSLNDSDDMWMNNISRFAGPEQYLWLLENAECVITDSYHGTIFSLLFKKQFATLKRFSADSPVCQNSRIYQLAEYFNIERNIQDERIDEIQMYPVDYEKFNIVLNDLRMKSIQFLSNALEASDA